MVRYFFWGFLALNVQAAHSQSRDTLVINGYPYTLINHNGQYLSDRNFNRMVNRTFGQVAVGTSGGPALTNYASADPINGQFAFNGFGSVSQKDTVAYPVYFSLSVHGNLIGTNSTELFTNSKLNTNAGAALKLHLGLSGRTISYLDNPVLEGRRDNLLKESLFKLQRVAEVISFNKQQLAFERFSLQVVANNLRDLRKDLADVSDSAVYYRASTRGRFEKLVDTAMKISAKIEKRVVDSFNISRRLDTLITNQALIDSKVNGSIETRYGDQQYEVISRSYEQQIDSLELKAPLSKTHFFWETLTLAFNRHKYYTYTDSLVFSKRISKQILDAFEIGAALNFFWGNFNLGNLFYGNLGISRKKDNNTTDLATTEVAEETDSDSGQVKRKVVTKYNVFTEPVSEYTSWLMYLNAYYMWGKQNKSGIHLTQEVDFRESHSNRINSGLGYIFSFSDRKDNKVVINLEAYIKFLDIANAQKDKSRFYNRNIAGINIGLPFSYIF